MAIDVSKLMDEVVSINNQLTGLKMLLDNKKKVLAKYFEKSGTNQLQNDEATVFVQERTQIEYDMEALQDIIDADLLSQFVDKKYTIPSWSTFVSFCKAHDIKPKQLKPYISVEKQVNQAKLSKLYELGKISVEDLEGCYSATSKKSIVLRMKNTPSDIPITHESK